MYCLSLSLYLPIGIQAVKLRHAPSLCYVAHWHTVWHTGECARACRTDRTCVLLALGLCEPCTILTLPIAFAGLNLHDSTDPCRCTLGQFLKKCSKTPNDWILDFFCYAKVLTQTFLFYFFFDRHYSLLSFWLSQRILMHINVSIWRLCQSPIQYALVFVELADKLYTP